MDPKHVGKIIRFHRKKSGMTQKEVADLGAIGKTAVFDVEKGKLSVQFDTLLKILHVLNIKIEFKSPLMALYEDQTNEKS